MAATAGGGGHGGGADRGSVILAGLIVAGVVVAGFASRSSAGAAELPGAVGGSASVLVARLPAARAPTALDATRDARDDARDDDADDGDTPAPKTDSCGAANAECRSALARLRADTLDQVNLDIRVGGRSGEDYPCECRLEGETFQPRRFAATTFTWKAAGYCHKPLYFEDWNLERYGHSHGIVLDPFLSAAHFFVSLPVLPYQMGVQPPWECVYPLGYYRPGSCAPWTVPAVPISGRGFAVQAATVTGLVFLLP